MSKADKALQKILMMSGGRNVTFDELAGMPRRKGFVHGGEKGSHPMWRHEGGRKIPLPRHGNAIKPIYVKTARQLLEEE